MLPSIINSIGFPVLLELVKKIIGSIDDPMAQRTSKHLDVFHGAIQTQTVKPESLSSAINQTLEKEKTLVQEINRSLRAEIESDDAYVRRMRPTFGYIMAITWGAQMLAIAYTILFRPEYAGELISAMASLSAIWGIGLSVLGVYVYKRSQDKSNIR